MVKSTDKPRVKGRDIAERGAVPLKPVRRAFKILLGAAAVIAIALAIAQDQATLKIRSARAPADADHAAYLAALVGADLTTGNEYQVLTNGVQIFPAMLEAIRSAKRRIAFETYVYTDGEMATQFTQALADAARRGVRVYLVLDAVGASGIADDHLEQLEAAGCRIARFNAPSWYALEELNYRTHRKILVVDGEIGFTGGAGVSDHWMGDADSRDHWRDTQILMRGPIVRLMEAAFHENFIEAADAVAPEIDPPGIDPTRQGGDSFLVRSSPTGGANDLKRLYLLAIASARRTLDIATPYFVTDESIEWAFREAVGRGVRIRILLESDITDAMPVKYASRHFYQRLMDLGVELHEYQPTMMHAKVMVVDGMWSMFGSANFDNRSLELNDELNVAVASRDLASRLLDDFEQDLRLAHRIDRAAWPHRPFIHKVRERFWSAFSEVF